MQFSSYWRTTFAVAFLLHVATWLGFSALLPYLSPAPKTEYADETELVDVAFAVEEANEAEETPAAPTEILPTPQEIAEPIEPPVYTEPIEPEEIVEAPPEEETTPVIADNLEEAVEKLERELEKENPAATNIVIPSGNKRMGEPPVVLTEAYPPKGSLSFGGTVSVAATIGTDGKVKKTRMMRKSGRIVIDNIAMSAAAKWTFKPALDQDGKPMECDKIITIDFRKLK